MWHERLKEQFKSDRKAAESLFTAWRKAARKEVDREKTTEVALANWIGTLHRKGDPTGWWRARPVLSRLLAEALGLATHEIFRGASQSTGPVFREFPALPPLGRDELPFRNTRAGSLFELTCAALGDTERNHWLVVAPGGGKTLVIGLLKLRGEEEVNALTVTRLLDAAAAARKEPARPLVVEVEESDPENDRAALTALELHQASVVVLAPFTHPDKRISESTSSLPGDMPTGRNETWATRTVTQKADWIGGMLAWLDARLEASSGETHFDTSEVLSWLAEHASVLKRIATPGDLLALCADFDAYGGEGSPHVRADRWLRGIGVKSLPPDAGSWADYLAADTLIAMTEADVLDRATASHERDFAGWASLVPQQSSSKGEDGPGAQLVVGLLRSAGLLRSDLQGAVVYPSWVAGALAERCVTQHLKKREVDVWGASAGDRSRQGIVDGCLDGLSGSELRAAGEGLLSSMSTSPTFAQVAALEALVAALARRLVRDNPDRGDADVAKRALALLLPFLASGSNIGPKRTPLTRRNRDEWFLSGWAISLATNRSGIEVPDDLRWVLPGWTSGLQLSEIDSDLPWSSTSEAVDALAALAPRVLARLTPSAVPSGVPTLFLPALFLSAGWELIPLHLMHLSGRNEEVVLLDALRRLDGEQRAARAELIWRLVGESDAAAPATPVAARILFLKDRHPRLMPFVLENLAATVVEETARTAGAHRWQSPRGEYDSDPNALLHLSPEQRAAAVRGRLSKDVRFDEVGQLLSALDPTDLEGLLDLARSAEKNVAWEFASRVWRVRPERAEHEAQASFEDHLPSAEAWFRSAPRTRLGALTQIVEAASQRPKWVNDWVIAKLLDAGPHAEALFRLLHREPAKAPARKRAR